MHENLTVKAYQTVEMFRRVQAGGELLHSALRLSPVKPYTIIATRYSQISVHR